MQSENKHINLMEYVKVLEAENKDLAQQLYVCQKELEKCYLQLKNSANKLTNSDNTDHAKRLNSIFVLQKEFVEAELQNSMQGQLLKLIEQAKNFKSILALPIRLFALYRKHKACHIPAKLGNENFHCVIHAYITGGENAIESLLDGVKISQVVRANAYTALAKHLKGKDAQKCLYYARKAYFLSPRPYRLKYFILRLYDIGDMLTAQVALGFLPPNTPMSEYESSVFNYLQTCN